MISGRNVGGAPERIRRLHERGLWQRAAARAGCAHLAPAPLLIQRVGCALHCRPHARDARGVSLVRTVGFVPASWRL